MKNTRLITAQGYAAIEEQLEDLETRARREVAERIKVAREFGDISENSEYDDAKNEQALLEKKIGDLRHRLKHAEIVVGKSNSQVVEVGSQVTFSDGKKQQTVEIVGHGEADPRQSKVSISSPIGSALAGLAAQASKQVKTPAGSKTLTVLKIN